MSTPGADTRQGRRRRSDCSDPAGPTVPRGVRLAAEGRREPGLIPDVPVRCRSQPDYETPRYARPRYAWRISEVGGAFGDLGTFLPHVIAAIVVLGMSPSGVLLGFGLYYLAAGAVFGVPMPVQPMKAASAAVLVEAMAPAEVAGAGLVIGAFFLMAGASGFITGLTQQVPASVTAGIQLGLGLALSLLGVRILSEQIWLAALVIAVVLLFLNNRRVPAALMGLGVGILVAATTGQMPSMSALAFGLHLPSFALPGWSDVIRGAELAAIPQIPLTLTNAIIVTAAVTARYFPKELHRVNERSLSISTGIANLLFAPFGGYPMCHGAGGMAAHYRFGARTATAPAVIGITLLGMGLLLGDDATLIMTLVPPAVVGALLLISGVELAWSAKAGEFRGADAWVVAVVAAVGIAVNLAVAFVLGLALTPLLRWLEAQQA